MEISSGISDREIMKHTKCGEVKFSYFECCFAFRFKEIFHSPLFFLLCSSFCCKVERSEAESFSPNLTVAKSDAAFFLFLFFII